MDSIRDGEAELTGASAGRLTRVLRVEAGQTYEISDDHSVWLAEITAARMERVIFRTLRRVEEHPASVRTLLFPALIKFDRFEWMIEKATELGVSAITPFQARRGERGLERAAEKRIERWRKLAVEASEQSRRDHLPAVLGPAAFEVVLAEASDYRLALDEGPNAPPIIESFPSGRAPSDRVAVLLGPEGGWTDDERAAFRVAGWTAVSLGPQILRAETAAAAALAIVNAAWQASWRG